MGLVFEKFLAFYLVYNFQKEIIKPWNKLRKRTRTKTHTQTYTNTRTNTHTHTNTHINTQRKTERHRDKERQRLNNKNRQAIEQTSWDAHIEEHALKKDTPFYDFFPVGDLAAFIGKRTRILMQKTKITWHSFSCTNISTISPTQLESNGQFFFYRSI